MSDFVAPWTLAHQAPLSMEFSRQEYWNGLPFPSPRDLPNPGPKLGLLLCSQILYCLSHQGSPLQGDGHVQILAWLLIYCVSLAK